MNWQELDDPEDTGAKVRVLKEGELEDAGKELAAKGCGAWYGRSYCGEPIAEVAVGDTTLAASVHSWLSPFINPQGIPIASVACLCDRHRDPLMRLADCAPEILEQIEGAIDGANQFLEELRGKTTD